MTVFNMTDVRERVGERESTSRPVCGSTIATSPTLAAMSLGFCVVQLDVTIVNTALNDIGRSLAGGVAELQWVVNGYTIAFAALILTAGALGDRLGAKQVFMSGFAIFVAASRACAVAPTAAALIAARAVQGVGAAILVPNSLAPLNHAYHDATKRGRAVGIWAAGASLALTAGPVVGGCLIALAGWRSIFLVNLPIGLLVSVRKVLESFESVMYVGSSALVPSRINTGTGLSAICKAPHVNHRRPAYRFR